jgi:hypothetical protein
LIGKTSANRRQAVGGVSFLTAAARFLLSAGIPVAGSKAGGI